MKKSTIEIDRSLPVTLFYGLITGAITGGVLSLFSVCTRVVGELVFGLYSAKPITPLAVVCVLILAVICCLLTAVVQTLVPAVKGSGIPLAEGAARGMLRVRWLRDAAAIIAGSLLAFTCGMPLGGEGPSVAVGGLIGEGVGKTAKKPTELRRYLITGGASAGLAAAFNAPLTGLAFAFEETHRRFSPYILAASLSAVIAAVAASQGALFGFSQIPYLAGIGVKAGQSPLWFLSPAAPVGTDILWLCLIAIGVGIVAAAVGIAVNRAIAALGKLFKKIKSNTLRLLPAFLLAAVCGLSMCYSVGSGETSLEKLYEYAVPVTVAVTLALRIASTAVAGASGATGGLFLPLLAIGGLTGLLASKGLVFAGLDEQYLPNVVVLCICAFFASSVRAPITAVIMSAELTMSFVNLLPCVIAVTVAVVITDISKTEPLYERTLESLVADAPAPDSLGDASVTGRVRDGASIIGKRIRNVMWHYNSLVTELKRDGVSRVPDGETQIERGDLLTIRAENVDKDYFLACVSEYIDVTPDRPPAPVPKSGYIATAKNKRQP